MLFLADNFAAILVAAVASTMVWLFGGARGEWLLPVVPWLSFFMIETLVCFPQKRHGETTFSARERVWRDLRSDPFTWVSVGLLLLLAVPFVNSGLCTSCDARLIAQGADPEPPLPFLPFCLDRIDHLNVFLWFLIVLPSAALVRHGLSSGGKRLTLQMIVWNGLAAATLGFVQSATGALGPYWQALPGVTVARPGEFFSTFGYPNMAGDYFTLLFGISVALWRDHRDAMQHSFGLKDISKSAPSRPRMFWKKNFYLIPIVVFFFAAINTLSRAAILLATATAAVYFLHALIVHLSHLSRARRLTVGTWSLLLFTVIVFSTIQFMPEDVQHEVDTLGTTEVLDRVTGRGQYHVQVATEIWKDHKLFGCGGWGYLHLCVPKMRELKIPLSELQTIGGINVHNDYLQLLAEHGLVGFGAMVALVAMLLLPLGRAWHHLIRELRFVQHSPLPRPRQIFVLPAGAFCLLIAILATFIHAFGDCPLRSLAVFDLFIIALASLPGFLSSHGSTPTTNH